MKTITFTLFALLVTLQMMAGNVIKNPEIEYSATWMTITEIEQTKEATIIRGILRPGCSILNNTVLADRDSGKEYKFLRVEGVNAYEPTNADTPCAIYFEPFDATVKEFNYIEVGNDPMGNYYGIKLQKKSETGKKSKEFDPESLNYDYYMNQPFTPDTEWKFSNKPHKNGLESGKALLTVHMTKTPKELAQLMPSAKVRVTNQITRHEENYTVSIDENSCYVINLDIPHPQFVYTNPFGSVFIAPGDTIDLFSTMDSAPDGSGPRFKTFRSNSESAMINTLLPKFMDKYGRKEYKYEEAQAIIEKGKDATQAILERWANQANEIVDDEELRKALINSPLSTYGKDLVMISILANKCEEIEDIVMSYTNKEYIYTQQENGNWKREENPDYVKPDLDTVYGTLLKNKELIYNNPLAISESNQWVFVNRTLYSPLFFSWEYVKDENGDIEQRHNDCYGMAGTFMNDLYLSQDITSRLENIIKADKLGQITGERTDYFDFAELFMGETFAGIQNVKVAQTIVGEYRKFVKATETAVANEGNNWTEEQNALWNKIVSPYKGNTLFLDFWGMSCGPCRSGMMNQRSLVEELKDENIKFLYITTERQKASAEKWMDENNIKGEHVYITSNEWNMFETMINFSGIPRGALVNKNGKLIENDFHIGNYESSELKKIAEKL